jgi:hypothetical protein
LDFLKNEVELYDSKIISQKKSSRDLKEDEKEREEEIKAISVRSSNIGSASADSPNYLQLTDIYNISKAVSHFPRELLPQVPETIRVLNPPKRREQK